MYGYVRLSQYIYYLARNDGFSDLEQFINAKLGIR
jgi:hypothetical protein